MKIRIAIADDHMVVRHGLGKIFNDEKVYEVVGEAVDAKTTLQLVRSTDIDVLVLDISMPGRSGIELIKKIKTEKPRLSILILSMHDEEQYAVRAIKAGASGHLTKGTEAEELIKAVDKIYKGGRYITAEVGERLASEFESRQNIKLHKLLSDREFEIFKMIVHGVKVGDIAFELNISNKTVSTHKARIFKKMQMNNSSDLVIYAIENNLRNGGPVQVEFDGTDLSLSHDVASTGSQTVENPLFSAYRLLSAKTDLHEAILNSANFSIIVTDSDGTIKIFNMGAERLLGYSSSEMVGLFSPLMFHVKSEIEARSKELSIELGRMVKPDFEVFTAKAMAGLSDESEWTVVRKDGRHLSTMLSVTAIRNDPDLLPSFLAIAYELAERNNN